MRNLAHITWGISIHMKQDILHIYSTNPNIPCCFYFGGRAIGALKSFLAIHQYDTLRLNMVCCV